jgi:molybdate transport system substrate-binding protein
MRWLALVACTLVALAGCGGGGTRLTGAVTVFVTPTLADAVAGAAAEFGSAHPGVRVDTLAEPDSQLVERAAGGASVDVFVAEDPATLAAAGATTEPVHLASGQFVLAVRAGNPALVRGVADLARPELRTALCAADEPCGAVADEVLAAAGVALPESARREMDVRAALGHVSDGTADVALVYRPVAEAAGDEVMIIEFPESGTVLADFVAAVPASAPTPDAARAFLDYLASSTVRDALTGEGFRPPE